MIYRDSDSKSVPRPKSAIYRDRRRKLRETGEMFVVPDCQHNMRIRELKNAMELVVVIPTDFQRVCYLDKGTETQKCDDLPRQRLEECTETQKLCETGEMFVVPDCQHNMRIRELKNAMELVVVIPTDFQRVCYLDKVKFSLGGRLRETGEMFVVPDCQHNMRIRELKNFMELVVVIPTDFQRVC
ncbi:unnamed protein product [Coregonus sp. 'balchen']|nr:unnamed protein product [Coregonus sp. 'balchen']